MLLSNIKAHVWERHRNQMTPDQYLNLYYPEMEEERKAGKPPEEDSLSTSVKVVLAPLKCHQCKFCSLELPKHVASIKSHVSECHSDRMTPDQYFKLYCSEMKTYKSGGSGENSLLQNIEDEKNAQPTCVDKQTEQGASNSPCSNIKIKSVSGAELALGLAQDSPSASAVAANDFSADLTDSNDVKGELDNSIIVEDNLETALTTNGSQSELSSPANSVARFACPRCDSSCVFFITYDGAEAHIRREHGVNEKPISLNG